jgi:LysM repeat protein
MPIDKHTILWLSGLLTILVVHGEGHTSPEKWKEPRLFHLPFDEQYSSRIRLDRCPIPAELPETHMAANNAYWFATIFPDRTNSGPWNTEVLVFTERDHLLRIQLQNIHYCRDIGWVTEKLLRIRVWWGRICATDLIVDVEQERIIYKEMVWDGGIAFQQFQAARQYEPKDDAATDGHASRSKTNEVRSITNQEVPEVLSPPSLLDKEPRTGATYEVGVYVVQRGDTLFSIVKRHNLRRVKELLDLNPELSDRPLKLGQQIRVYERLRD